MANSELVPPDASNALTRAYNRWLCDYCALNPQRLKGVGMLSRHDPPAMLSELEQIVAYGWQTVVLRPEVILGRHHVTHKVRVFSETLGGVKSPTKISEDYIVVLF